MTGTLSWISTIVQGVLLGGLYALFAMSQSLIFGVMRLTNTAHGDFIILAAFGAFSIAAGMQWLSGRTALGRSFRAVSDDRDAAELMGLDHRHVYAMATGIAFALVAVAGALHGMKTTFAPSDGPALLLYGFEAVIIG